jgi:predicted PurR-regulated permease PerM
MSLPPPTQGQSRIIWTAVTGLAIAVIIGLVVGLIWGISQVLTVLGPVLWPIAIAGVIAYLLDPVVDFLEHRRIPRTRAILVVFVAALLVVAGIAGSVIPQVVVETQSLVRSMPGYANSMGHRVGKWMANPPALVQMVLKKAGYRDQTPVDAVATGTNDLVLSSSTNGSPWTVDTNAPAFQGTNTPPAFGGLTGSKLWSGIDKDTIQFMSSWLARVLPTTGNWLLGQLLKVTSWFGLLAGLALIPVYAFYFLIEKRGIESYWTDYLPVRDSAFKQEVVFVLSAINEYLVAFFRGQVLVAICDGILYTIGFLIIGLPYAILIGVAAIFLTIIPFIGAFIVCASALIISLVQYGDVLHPALVLVVFGVVQGLEGLVVQPKIMGDRVGLHPLAIIIAVMVGTTLLGGILGGILAIPLTAALRVLMFRYVWKKRGGS